MECRRRQRMARASRSNGRAAKTHGRCRTPPANHSPDNASRAHTQHEEQNAHNVLHRSLDQSQSTKRSTVDHRSSASGPVNQTASLFDFNVPLRDESATGAASRAGKRLQQADSEAIWLRRSTWQSRWHHLTTMKMITRNVQGRRVNPSCESVVRGSKRVQTLPLATPAQVVISIDRDAVHRLGEERKAVSAHVSGWNWLCRVWLMAHREDKLTKRAALGRVKFLSGYHLFLIVCDVFRQGGTCLESAVD